MKALTGSMLFYSKLSFFATVCTTCISYFVPSTVRWVSRDRHGRDKISQLRVYPLTGTVVELTTGSSIESPSGRVGNIFLSFSIHHFFVRIVLRSIRCTFCNDFHGVPSCFPRRSRPLNAFCVERPESFCRTNEVQCRLLTEGPDRTSERAGLTPARQGRCLVVRSPGHLGEQRKRGQGGEALGSRTNGGTGDGQGTPEVRGAPAPRGGGDGGAGGVEDATAHDPAPGPRRTPAPGRGARRGGTRKGCK